MDKFVAAAAGDTDLMAACDTCIAKLSRLPANVNLGFVYASHSLAHGLDLIATRLAEATGVRHWVGTGGSSVCIGGQNGTCEAMLAVMVAGIPEEGFRLFDGLVDAAAPRSKLDLRWGNGHCGLVHGDPRNPRTPAAIAQLGKESGAFLVGGLTSSITGGVMQVAGQPTEGGLSGALFSADVPIIAGLSQGCTPIGRPHEITMMDGPWVAALDGKPALLVLKAEVGDVLSRHLGRMSGFIHAARPQFGANATDYLVRELGEIDPLRHLFAVVDELRPGDALMFVKRDAAAARADLLRMIKDLRERADDRPIRGALYHSCVIRGPRMFGSPAAELDLIGSALGSVPLVGLFTNGEIFRDRLYGYSAVLTLFLG